MRHFHQTSQPISGPETSGITISWAARYDFLSGLLGLGVNQPNSRMVVELAGIKTGESVLDVGCGTGSLTLTAKATTGANGTACGIDAAPEMIAVARKKAQRAGQPVNFEVGLAEKIPFPEARFDVVISRLVIHHLPGDLKRRGFEEMYRVLKTGGRLLIADFRAPTNPVLKRLVSLLFGPAMAQANLGNIPELLSTAGFVEVTSGPTRSAFLAFVSGKKPPAWT